MANQVITVPPMEVMDRKAQTTAATALVLGMRTAQVMGIRTAPEMGIRTALRTGRMATGSTPFRSRLVFRFGVPTTCWFSI